MRQVFVRLPSPAMTVALVALFVALGGTSYAAFTLSKNSVGTKQLKNGAVATQKLHNGAVSTVKLRNGAVTGQKMNFTGVTVPTAVNAGHASTADNATNAGHASTADNATNASNSTELGGVGQNGYESRVMWALISGAGTVVAQSGGISVETHPFPGGYYVAFPQRVQGKAISVTPSELNESQVTVVSGPCGGSTAGPDAVHCANGSNTANDAYVATFNSSTQAYADQPFYIAVLP